MLREFQRYCTRTLWAAGLTAALGSLLVCLGCSSRPSFRPGEECDLTADCPAALVCRLGHCRIECRATRDCPIGLACVRDEGDFGACQLDDEAECAFTSECPDHLVCSNETCTNACGDDRDCPPGAVCAADADGVQGCIDPSMDECVLNSDCGELLLCAPDNRCREACRQDRDCRDGTVCAVERDPNVCVLPSERDAGVPDAASDAVPDVALDAVPDALDDAGVPDAVPDAAMDAATADADGAMAVADATPDGGVAMAGAGSPGAASIAGGFTHSCGRLGVDDIRCWGDNTNGKLGDGTTNDSTSPVMLVVVAAGVQHLTAGAFHSCAQTEAGLFCWGLGDEGQLGTGAFGVESAMPLEVALTSQNLVAGRRHTCAIDTAGAVFCWGLNDDGQLGTGSFARAATPQPVSVVGAAQLTARSGHTCALLDSGQVWCWGRNGNGQLGDGTTVPRNTPTRVTGLTGATQVVAGGNHTCALVTGGAVRCWGDNIAGQLGVGDTTERLSQTATMPLAAAATKLGAGLLHTCALLSTGRISCWGDNTGGPIAQPILTFESPVPLLIDSPLSDFTEIIAGDKHTCALRPGEYRCWGDNSSGVVGDGTTLDRYVPVPVVW